MSKAKVVPFTNPNPAKPDPSAALTFLLQLRPSGPWVLTAIRPDPVKDRSNSRTRVFRPDQGGELVAWVQEHLGEFNLYVHVNPLVRDVDKKAERTDVAALEYIHVDIDTNAPGAAGDEAFDRERAASRAKLEPEALARLGLPPPTLIVDSGNGYNAYWRLSEPVRVDGNLAKAEEHLKILDRLCFFPCNEYTMLKTAVAAYKRDHPQNTASR